MKLITIFWFAVIMQVSVAGFAQNISYSQKNTTLERVFREISRQTGYDFVVSSKILKESGSISVDFSNLPIKEVMEKCLYKRALSYTITDKTIVVMPQLVPLIGEMIIGAVRGIVTDPVKGEGLSCVTVKIDDGSFSKTTFTDTSGNYRFAAVPAGRFTLTFTSIGFEKVTRKSLLKDGETQEINVVLKEDIGELAQVVVVGYGTQTKANLTGAVASITSKSLENRPLVNLGQGLQGLIPGLNVNLNNGAPGQGASFNIRGTTSINGGDPLVLVDGVQMSIDLINPDDVESVSVLKDASAAAIYGGRAAFGVILITTKSPKGESAPKLSYSANYSLSGPTVIPDFLTGPDFIRLFRAAKKNFGGSTEFDYSDLDQQMADAYFRDPKNNPDAYQDPANPTLYRYVGNTDWADLLYHGYEPTMSHSLSLSGGESKTTYLASVGYFNQKGLLKFAHTNSGRINANLKIKTELKPWLSINLHSTLNYTDLNTPLGVSGNLSNSFIPGDLPPIQPVYNPDGNFSGQGRYTNQVALMTLGGRDLLRQNDFWLGGGVAIKPFRHVKITTDYSWNKFNNQRTRHFKEYNEYGYDGVFLNVFPNTKPARVIQSNANDIYYALNSYAEYENTLAKKHYLKVLLGYNEELKQLNSINAAAKNLIDQTQPFLNPNFDDHPIVGQSVSEWAVSGTFFRLNYGYDNKYLIELNGRYDGSSRFKRGSRYIFTPSFSAGWMVSEEQFFSKLKNHVNQVKFRGSYGTLGNQNTTLLYPYISNFTVGQTGYIFNNNFTAPTVGLGNLVNADLGWEKVTTFNLGIDATLLKNRMTINFDRYTRKTTGMIVSGLPLPSVLGTGAQSRNDADLKITGWELNLAWRDRLFEKLAYSVGFNVSDFTGKITKFDLNPTSNLGNYYVGYEIGEAWGYTTAGFFQSQEEITAAPFQEGNLKPGDIRYADLDGNNKINGGSNTSDDPGDRSRIGNTNARYRFGFNLGLEYKGFDFTTFFQGIMKGDAWLDGNYFWGFTDEYSVPVKTIKDSWTPDNRNAYFPLLRIEGWHNWQTQTKYKQSLGYARLKQITLGYTLPDSLLKRAGLNHARVYFTGQNLFEYKEMFDGFDPEVLNAVNYPLSRSFSFGIQLAL
jgi:TonB-linked SusC/RagA family outer membrane protein